MLTVSPRFDLFRFALPKDFLPKEVEDKYSKIINKEKSIITTPIDYINESIQAITIPGISELVIEQDQHSSHSTPESYDRDENFPSKRKLHRHINVEPDRKNLTYNSNNPLSQIGNEIKVTFRQNQGLLNYWMLYESILYKVLKQYDKHPKDDCMYIELLDETGVVNARIIIYQPRVDGIEGLEFSYNKIERSASTFDITFKYNNISFDILERGE